MIYQNRQFVGEFDVSAHGTSAGYRDTVGSEQEVVVVVVDSEQVHTVIHIKLHMFVSRRRATLNVVRRNEYQKNRNNYKEIHKKRGACPILSRIRESNISLHNKHLVYVCRFGRLLWQARNRLVFLPTPHTVQFRSNRQGVDA
jgi:hypothetical protein